MAADCALHDPLDDLRHLVARGAKHALAQQPQSRHEIRPCHQKRHIDRVVSDRRDAGAVTDSVCPQAVTVSPFVRGTKSSIVMTCDLQSVARQCGCRQRSEDHVQGIASLRLDAPVFSLRMGRRSRKADNGLHRFVGARCGMALQARKGWVHARGERPRLRRSRALCNGRLTVESSSSEVDVDLLQRIATRDEAALAESTTGTVVSPTLSSYAFWAARRTRKTCCRKPSCACGRAPTPTTRC